MKMLLEFKAGKWSRVQYYTQFVNVDVTSLVLSAFGIERLAAAYLADNTFATIPPEEFERVAIQLPPMIAYRMIAAGDELNADSGVEVVKACAFMIATGETNLERVISIYEEMVAAGVPCHNHESDLYVPKNATTIALLKTYEFRQNVTTFENQRDGGTWFDIPFAFTPFWTKKQQQHERLALS